MTETITKRKDRTCCYVCGVTLSEENAYSRKDTANRLHALCKYHYIRQQIARTCKNVKTPEIMLLVNVCGKKTKITFQTKEEKQTYIRERTSLQKFATNCEMTSSCVGCTEDWGTGEDLRCDWCNALLRYNRKGELQCEGCDLIADVMPIPTDREYYYDKRMLQDKKTIGQTDWYWLDQTSGGSSFDVFYQKAYSKKLKR